MVAKGDKEVKEQLAASVEHLQLHRAAALERASAADDQRQVVCAKLRVGVGCIGVSISGRGKNGAGLDSRFCDEVSYCRIKGEKRIDIRKPCFRRATRLSSSSPYFSAAQ